jgi:mannose-6-phosphate isomerase-like protein (cupin superfamily)
VLYKPKYLELAEIKVALEQHGFEVGGKGRPDTNDKLQVRLRRLGKETSTSLSIVPEGGMATWENAHKHKGQSECFLVLEGIMVLAFRTGTVVKFYLLRAGDSYMFRSGTVHNALVFPGSVSVVSKIGQPILSENGDDWWSDKDFDRFTKSVTPDEAIFHAGG